MLSPYQNRRWDSDFLTVQALVADGALGDVRRFESRFERFAPESGPGAAGGGTLLDFCSHLVDQSLVLLGAVGSVYAELTRGSRAWTTTSSSPCTTPPEAAPTCGAAGSSRRPAHGSA